MGIAPRLQSFLEDNRIAYEAIHHRKDYTAKEAAEDTHTAAVEFAKTVFIRLDSRYAMAVLPADHWVSTKKLRDALGVDELRLATEGEVKELCPDCDVGAAPPFGNLYNLSVYVSPTLTKDEEITFNAGSHEDAIRMTYRDFSALVQPEVISMSKEE